MLRSERIAILIMIILSAGFASAALVDLHNQKVLERQKRIAELNRLAVHVPVQTVIGRHPDFLGDSRSPYTLVEFGDYQCPPCHMANQQLTAVLPRYQGKVRFTFRNLPLTALHPYAMPAAIVAEIAREQGRFWVAHDFLYHVKLNDASIATVTREQTLDSSGNTAVKSSAQLSVNTLVSGK